MKVKLGDVCEKASSNIKQSDIPSNKGVYPIYGASGLLGKVNFFHQEKPYIAVIKDGAGIGRAILCPEKSSVIGTLQYLLPRDNVLPQYLYYVICHMHLEKYFTGATIPHIYFKDYKNEPFNLVSRDEQQRIINVLGLVENIIDARKKEIVELDNLVKSRFVEMFGDGNYSICNLYQVSNIVSGITKGRKTKDNNLLEVPYMAVSNVKRGFIDWSTIKTILATKAEVEQYRLKSNDVLITEGGDPDKVGRGAVIINPPKNCIHQNHIFRVRLNCNLLTPEYFEEYLQCKSARKYFLKAAKQTTGIASINMKQLRGLPVALPPIGEQIRFSIFTHHIEKSKLSTENSRKMIQNVIKYREK
jgi:type I restriction enzyme S subunit